MNNLLANCLLDSTLLHRGTDDTNVEEGNEGEQEKEKEPQPVSGAKGDEREKEKEDSSVKESEAAFV